jgi:hypothetical protein
MLSAHHLLFAETKGEKQREWKGSNRRVANIGLSLKRNQLLLLPSFV